MAQTKLIAHKSLSGTNHGFAKTYAQESTVLDGSNFGVAPRRRDMFRNASSQPQLDTVIFLSTTHAIMVTSCEADKKGGEPYTPSPFWRPGHDTVLNHPLFSKNHSLDSIKQVLKSDYNFANDIEKTVFLGYDNDKEQMKGWRNGKRKNEKNALPIVSIFNETIPPNGHVPVLFISLFGVLSILLGTVLSTFSRRTT